MEYSDAVLTIIGQAGGGILTRSVVRHMVYFASQKEILEDDFTSDHFGPRSSGVNISILSLMASNFLTEELGKRAAWSSNERLYTYSLTEEGRLIWKDVQSDFPDRCANLKTIVETSKNIAQFSFPSIACAAKVHYTFREQKLSINERYFLAEAQKFNWYGLDDSEKRTAFELLRCLGLTNSSTNSRVHHFH